MGTTRKLQNLIVLIVFAVVSIGAMELFAFNIGQPNPFNAGYKVKAVFSDADGLPTAAEVRVAGVSVGKVTDVSKADTPGFTVATMDIHDNRAQPVYSDGFAKVRPKTLLGEKYIDLDLGGVAPDARQLSDGGMLSAARGTKTVSNDEIFNAFDAPTRKQQQEVIAGLDKALRSRGGDVQTLLPQLDTVVANLQPLARVYEKDNPSVDQIFTNLDTVMKALADEHVQLGQLLSNGNIAVGAIASRDDALITTLRAATKVQNILTDVTRQTIGQQQASIQKSEPTIAAQHAFIDQVIYPQAACHGRPCGFLELVTGTLLGQINYPNDQLTLSSPEGEFVTREYESLFSVPTTNAKDPSSHSALSIVLAEHCDTIQTTINNLIPGQLQSLVGPVLSANGPTGTPLIQSVCQALANRPASAPVPAQSPATTASLLTGMAGLSG